MRRERWLVLASVALYLLSLRMPAVAGSGFPTQSGWDMLQQGAGAWRDGVVAWYANPALWLTLVLVWFASFRLAAGAAVAGVVLALSSFAASPAAEAAGRTVPSFSFASGFYVWLAAFGIAALAAVLGVSKGANI